MNDEKISPNNEKNLMNLSESHDLPIYRWSEHEGLVGDIFA
jgi:hypothetical protein